MHDASGRASEPSCIDHRAGSAQSPESLYESHMIQHRHTTHGLRGRRSISFGLLTSVLLLTIVLFATACGSRAPEPAARDAALRRIATEYAANGDLKQAQASLDKLNLANPGQLLLSLAESDLGTGSSREDVRGCRAARGDAGRKEPEGRGLPDAVADPGAEPGSQRTHRRTDRASGHHRSADLGVADRPTCANHSRADA